MSLARREYILVGMLIVGALAVRAASLSWNTYVHGDVGIYAKSAESLATRGTLLVSTETDRPYFYSLKAKGGRILDHNPLWPVLASPLVKFFNASGYGALQALSYIFGAVLLFLVYALGKRMGGEKVGLLALAFSSLSFTLIDYSANGSFYILQAVFYVAFVLAMLRIERWNRVISAGGIMGFGLLLNQQTLILVPALFLVLAVRFYKAPLEGVKRFLAVLGIMMLIYAPWGIRNYREFGAPFYSVDMSYVWDKLGVPREVAGDIVSFPITGAIYMKLARQSLASWLPHNAYFINRKLIVLAPVTYVLAIFFLINYLFRKREDRSETWFLPLMFVFLFHALISSAWPIAKFRYFVPLLPLAFLVGSQYIFHMVKAGALRRTLVVSSVALTTIVSTLTFLSTPTHTDYYDGALTTDNFGRNGELDFILQTKSGELDPEW